MNICERLRNYKLKQNKSFWLLILVKLGAVHQRWDLLDCTKTMTKLTVFNAIKNNALTGYINGIL